MKPQLTVLIPLVGLSAYLIFKPSSKEQDADHVNAYNDQPLSDSLKIDSLEVLPSNKTIGKTKE